MNGSLFFVLFCFVLFFWFFFFFFALQNVDTGMYQKAWEGKGTISFFLTAKQMEYSAASQVPITVPFNLHDQTCSHSQLLLFVETETTVLNSPITLTG